MNAYRCLRALATVLVFWLAGLPATRAQEAGSTNVAGLKPLDLEQLFEVKVQTVCGASKHEQKVTEAPSFISIVTQDDIKQYGHRTLGEVLCSAAGFYVTDDRGYNAVGIWRINIPGAFGGRLLITVDGHRLNDPICDTAASGTDFLLDVNLRDRVEVIRGPGSSLYGIYGNNAFFEVINDITRKGRDVNGTEFSASAGSFDTYTGRASFGNRFTNGVELLATGVLHKVGNVLNSVSVSATLVRDRLRQSTFKNMCRAMAMLRDQNGRLVEFLTTDPKGQVLPRYLAAATRWLSQLHNGAVAHD